MPRERGLLRRRRVGVRDGRWRALPVAGVVACLFLLLAGPASAQVYRWGTEGYNSTRLVPLAVAGLREAPTVVDASNASSYALEPDGSEWAWGAAGKGQLGDGNKVVKYADTAVPVDFPERVKIVAIGEARSSGFAVDSTGQGWAWGEGGSAMFCPGTAGTDNTPGIDIPQKVPGITDAVAVQGAETHVLWLLANGTVVGCGDNAHGQLGLPQSVKQATKATQVPGLTHVVELSAGTQHSLARTASGKVYGFGANKEGQLCLGKPANLAQNYVYAPIEIPLPGAASDISGGGNNTEEDGHSLFLVEGVPYGCGADEEGELGDGSTVIKYTPTVSSGLLTLGLTQVATAGETSVGLSSSGEVYTWGFDIYGDLGNGSETGLSLSPLPIASGGVEVSATSWNMIYRSPDPPTVTTGTASAVTQTTATLGGSVNPNGGAVGECKLEYGTSTSYGASTTCNPAPGSGSSPVAVSASATGVAANTTYHFRITATNVGGTSQGSDQTFTTLPDPPTVSTGTASAVSQTTATLGGSVNPNGGAVGECKLEYGTSTSYGASTTCNPAPGSSSSPVAVSASASGLAANTTYHFRITATNAGGTSQGSDQTFTTLPDPPTVATGTASAVSQTTATLGGSVNPNGGGVGECELEYGTSTSYGASTTCNPAPGSSSSPVAVSASATVLAANTTYHFRITATNAGGTSQGSDQTFTTLPDPPTVSTGTASAVSQTTATLGGSVNPNGAEVSECKLEYGTSTSYGASTTCNPAPGSGSSPVAVSAAITGLAANTTYHFRITATNAGGTSQGSDQTFTTLPDPPTVTTGTASAVTQTSATLGASVNPNGGEVSECELEYGTSTSYGSSTTCNPAPGSGSSPVPVTAPATGLAANTTYHFRITATNAGGTSQGSDQTFTTLPNPPTVTTGTASAVTQTTATLGGSVNPNAGEVSECKLEYGTSTSYGASTTCNPAPGSGSSPVAVSASLTGLAANTTYHFRIVASNAGGTSQGSDQTFTTLPDRPTVSTGTASAVTQTTATLRGSVNPNGGEVSECELEYGTSTSYGTSTTCNPAPGSSSSPVAVTAPATGLASNTTYHFRITATNAGGTSHGSDQTFTTLPDPPTVATGTASAVTQSSATLGGSVNPNGGEVSECELEYGTSTSYGSSTTCNPAPGSGSSPVPVTAPATGLAANTTYHYRVVASNAGGTSYGNDQTFTTLPDPPTVATGTASAVTQSSATLGGSVNPNGGEVSECELEYGTSTSYGSSTTCNPAPGSGSSPVPVTAPATGLAANTTYHYRVVASNAGGTSQGSDQTFTTLPDPPTVATGTASAVTQTTATLGGSVNPNGGEVSECELEYGTSTSYGASTTCNPAPGSGSSAVAVSASLTGLAANTTYHYRVVASNAGGTSYGNDQTFTTLPDPPTVATGTASAVTQSSATLGGSVNPNGGEVSECELEYGTSTSYGSSTTCNPAPGSGSSPVPVTAPATGLAANTTYHFRIVASNAGGTSYGSDQTLTTLPDPPTVATGTASAVTQTTATLGGSVNPNGAEVSECELEYGTSTSYGASTTCNPAPGSGSSPVAVSASLTGLAANTTYHSRVVASNAGGTSQGSDQTFTTLANPPTAPEFGRCIKVAAGTGKYANTSCTALHGQEGYEWSPGVLKPHFATQITSGSVTLEAVKGSRVTCKSETGTGEYTGLKTVGGVVITLTGCELLGDQCSSAGALAGEIVTQPLEGVLGIDKLGATSSQDLLGLDLFPIGRTGSVMEFSCGVTPASVQGSVIVPVKADKMFLTSTLRYSAAKGKQKPESFAGEPRDILEASLNVQAFEQLGLTLETTQTNSEAVEVNAVV